MTNWFDPESPVVRRVLIAVMLASLLMAVAIPEAFGDRALLFGASYAALQIVRNVFAVFGSPRAGRCGRRWPGSCSGRSPSACSGCSAACSTAGADRIWLVALALDYAGPYAGYWCPVSGGGRPTDWEIDSAHFAERFQLFVLIALGESIVVMGAAASALDLDLARARPSRSPFSARPRSGGSTSTTSPPSLSAGSTSQTIAAASPETPIPTSTSRWSRESSFPPSPTSSSSPTPETSYAQPARRGRRRAGALFARPRSFRLRMAGPLSGKRLGAALSHAALPAGSASCFRPWLRRRWSWRSSSSSSPPRCSPAAAAAREVSRARSRSFRNALEGERSLSGAP